jgi:serine/threonine protein kinase
MLKTVTHPYVIKLLDIFHGDGRLYLVMELVRGGDLFDRIIDKGRYSEELARELVSSLIQIQYHNASYSLEEKLIKCIVMAV